MPKSTAAKKAEQPAATPTKAVVAPGVSGKARESAFPKGVTVRYTGARTQFAGQTGIVTGYRGPTTGLWVKFPTGLGSISSRGAEIVSGGKKAKPAAKAASRVKKETPAQAEPEPSEPSQEAQQAS